MAGRVALVTGGTRGIGEAICIALKDAGYRVVANYGHNDAAAKAFSERTGIAIEKFDVSDFEACQAAVKKIAAEHGPIDVLVNSAGINSPKRNFKNVSLDTWNQIVAVNLSGMFYCCHAVLPGMRERKEGLIINISSWAGRYASTLTGPGYNATKHAVVALTESINMEECANGIRATSILPGEVATPILEKRPVPPTPEVRARMLQAEDLGATILYVATLPPRACVNELIISPTWNRFYLGGFETPKN